MGFNTHTMKKTSLFIYQQIKRSFFKWRTRLFPATFLAQCIYLRRCGKLLNLKNPQTMDEKLWWLKLHEHHPLQPICADKYRVREYVRQCGLGHLLNDCYGPYERVGEVPLNEIPYDEFFLKCNHLSGGNRIVRKDDFKDEKLKEYFDNLLKNNAFYYGLEWPYKDIKPLLIAEPVISSDDPFGLLDYKFMCFGGVPKLLFLDIGVCEKDGSHAEKYYRNVYDMNFQLQNITETRPQYTAKRMQKPPCFEQMIAYAARLSAPFRHCRVDLYNVKGRIYFGEITFYHGSGCNHLKPTTADQMIGSWIKIDCIS